MKPVTSQNSPPRNCSPGEKDFTWGSNTLFTIMPIPILVSRLGVSEIDAGEIAATFSSKIESKLGEAQKDCEMPG